MQAAKGLQGGWHFTTGEWKDQGHLLTLCGRGVGSHHREMARASVDCEKCNREKRKLGVAQR